MLTRTPDVAAVVAVIGMDRTFEFSLVSNNKYVSVAGFMCVHK